MKIGLLRTGDPADFILVNNLENFEVKGTYINGQLVAANGHSNIKAATATVINQFECKQISAADLQVQWKGEATLNIIEALDGQLITNKIIWAPKHDQQLITSDPVNDVLKIVVVNRYKAAPIAKAFIKNFGIRQGLLPLLWHMTATILWPLV
jgi:adenine deaminase